MLNLSDSDYQRNGVFIKEINNSVIDKPAPQEAIINFVPGFSKKGTTFNKPLLVKSTNDRLKYFGDIDRFLEKKASFFHRTIDVALQTAPVQAMNILKTNSLDTLNYKSISLAAQYNNDVVLTEQYDSFFNKTGFWQRDTESFLFFAKNSDRMLHITNMSDKNISVFMFKATQTQGFNITAEKWFPADKIPSQMNKNDLISDYMVRVVVVSGDQSNYVTLAADSNWSKYFSSNGLRKDKVDNFVRDNSVTLLGDYTGSLIPYFVDQSGNQLFIETLINLETERTGLFASFDIEAVETDFPNGKIDIIGQTLVGIDKSSIDFMSYSDTIEEVDTYETISLDTLGNVIGIGSIATNRQTTKINGLVSGLVVSSVTNPTTTNPSLTYTSTSAFCIINNIQVDIDTTAITLNTIATPSSNTNYRIDLFYIDSDGVINVLEGTIYNGANSLTEANAVIAGLTYPATYPNNAILLGYVFRRVTSAGVYATTLVNLSVNTSGYVPLRIGGLSTNDIQVINTSNNILSLSFTGTSTATKAKYVLNRRLQFFNELVTKKSLTNSVIIDSNGDKISLANCVQTDNYTVSGGGGDKIIVITAPSGKNIKMQSYVNSTSTAGNLVFYFNDNEFYFDPSSDLTGIETRVGLIGTADYGVVSKFSEFYKDFYNGAINTGDYFYVKIADTTSLKFVHYTDLSFPDSVGDYIIMNSTDATALNLSTGANNLRIKIDSHPVNTGDFLLTDGENNSGTVFAPGLVNGGYLLGGEIAFKVNNLVTTYTTLQNIEIFDYNQKVYLKMYFIGSDLKCEFMADNTLETPFILPNALLSINEKLNVYSGEASYEQTLEIETHSSYTITDTKILVDSVRYPEVKVGDFLKAYYDVSELLPGEYPKKFARIIKKTPQSGNTVNNVQYSEITTDIKIDITAYYGGTDYQTTRYTTIEDYIDTYKAISLKGFVVQSTAIPNGTETRQNDILNVIGKTTPLYNAIVNKNKFNFRYLIDSFGLGLTEFSKQQLVDICGGRKNCIGFINMPSAKNFKQSSNPSFINTDGTLNLDYVRLGGNPEANPNFLYSLAQGSGDDDGRPCVGYFFPYVTIGDNGRPLSFPPAAYVHNTYMRKINSTTSGIYNQTIAAGISDGRILGIANTEMDFTVDDLKSMFQMGINPIMYLKDTAFYLENEFTASTDKLSSLSFLHCREVLIDLENELYKMLFKYQHKFNTTAVRAKIKREADDICQKYVDTEALYAYTNVIDTSNNTPTIIDNQFGLLETYVEIVKGMSRIVNIINVMQTGAIGTSTGFN